MTKKNTKYMTNDRNDIIKASRKARFILSFFSLALGLIFTYLKLKGISLVPFINDLSVEFILKISLTVYYFSWIVGLSSDINDQVIVQIKGLEKKYLSPAWPIAFIGFIGFALLCYVNNFKVFTIALLMFWVINLFGWGYLVIFILDKMFVDSQKEYQRSNSFSLYEKLEVVKNYTEGNWQWIRFIIGLLIIIIAIVFAFTPISLLVSRYLRISSEIINAFSVSVYIIFMETMMWIMRIKVKVSFQFIEKMDNKYRIKVKKESKEIKVYNITERVKSRIKGKDKLKETTKSSITKKGREKGIKFQQSN
mgnify:CR=1 FL=1